MTVERITADEVPAQHGHRDRYELAASLVRAGDTVLDAACGIGYGAAILAEHAPAHAYWGVDRDGVDPRYLQHGWFTHANLDTWQPDFEYDVAISFETLEHVHNPQHLATTLSLARRTIIVSVPTVPTTHFNKFHTHDFTADDIPPMFPNWELAELIPQPSELSHIFIFRKAQP